MADTNEQYIVISLGGSLIVPDAVDTDFLKQFVMLIQSAALNGKKFAIVCGGGKVARQYQQALSAVVPSQNNVLDWMGIYACRLNAQLVRLAFGDSATTDIFLDPTMPIQTDKSIIVGGGWKPGHSSDGAAVGLAKALGAQKLINLSNIDYVYTADPRKDPSATPIADTTWTEFRKLLPAEWDPGINTPFDPIAAKMAEEMGLEVAVVNGKNLENLAAYIDGKPFVGTRIQ